MSLFELKEAAAKLTRKEREELHAFLIQLRHDTPAWKRKAARTIRQMQDGKRMSAEAIRARIARVSD